MPLLRGGVGDSEGKAKGDDSREMPCVDHLEPDHGFSASCAGEYVVYVYDSLQYPFFRGEEYHQLATEIFLQRFCLAMRLDSTQLRFHPNNVIQRPVPVSYTSTLKDVQACHRLVPARQWFASCGRKAWDGWMIQTGLSAYSDKALESLQTWRGCPVLPFSEIVFLIVPQPWIGPRCLQPFFFAWEL